MPVMCLLNLELGVFFVWKWQLHFAKKTFWIWFQLAKDLLHPRPEEEKRKHKLKRLVQHPNSYFMDVKCPGCYKITTVFSHAQTVVLCVGCSTVLCQPTGGRARLTEGKNSASVINAYRSSLYRFCGLFQDAPSGRSNTKWKQPPSEPLGLDDLIRFQKPTTEKLELWKPWDKSTIFNMFAVWSVPIKAWMKCWTAWVRLMGAMIIFAITMIIWHNRGVVVVEIVLFKMPRIRKSYYHHRHQKVVSRWI